MKNSRTRDKSANNAHSSTIIVTSRPDCQSARKSVVSLAVIITVSAATIGLLGQLPEPDGEPKSGGWDPVINPSEFHKQMEPFKTEEQKFQEELAIFSITYPREYAAQVFPPKTKEQILKDEQAMFAITNPEEFNAELALTKTEKELSLEREALFAITQLDLYSEQRVKVRTPEEARLRTASEREILNPESNPQLPQLEQDVSTPE